MTIRLRIRLLQLAIGSAVLLMAAVVYLAIRSADYHLQQVGWAHRQLEAITALRVHANQYSESLAELLLIGDAAKPVLDDARRQIDAALDALEDAIDGQVATAHSQEVRRRELSELERIERIRRIYQATDASVGRILALRDGGHRTEALGLFLRDIANRFEPEAEALMAEATAGERREVEETDREAAATRRTLMALVVAALILALAITLIAGRRHDRSITRPIRDLTTGATALAQGDLSYRIDYAGQDELGLLAARFNDMADQLKEQHGRLLAARAQLEDEVSRRTADLEAANNRLRDLDRQRVQFLTDISHELRTPLAVLRGEAEVMLRQQDATVSSYRESLAYIAAEAGDMARLVDDLLFLARSETDTIRFDWTHLDLRMLVNDAVRDARTLGRPKEITVEFEATGSPVVVEGDRQRLKQTLAIILDNAVKYSDPGSAIAIALTAGDAEAEISVRNSGEGVAPEDLPYVFERFYRGRERDADGADGGSGLGLSIARWIVEKHRGAMSLVSSAGCTEVRIQLPRAG